MRFILSRSTSVNLAIALMLVVSFIVSIASYRNFAAETESDAWTIHTYQVISQLEALQRALSDVEALNRGVVITGDTSVLSTHRATIDETGTILASLKELTRDNPRHQARLARLEELVARRLRIARDVLQTWRTRGRDATAPFVARGTAASRQIRGVLGEMEREERALLASRTEQDLTSTRHLKHVILAGGLLNFLLLVFAIVTLRRDLRIRRAVEDDVRRARDAAEEAARLKGDFLAKMSHEIRTPMNGVIGMAELLLDTALAPTQRQYVEAISNSGEHLLAIVNDILDFSKIEAGKLRLERTRFDPAVLIHEAVELFAPGAGAKGLQIGAVVDARLPAGVVGDPNRLRQVLTNLVGNAVKFTQHGEVIVRLLFAGRSQGRVRLRFDVSDTGIGISEEDRARLFQAFSQADNSATRRFGGTGLGLVISQHLVEAMGGRIEVESILGVGSTFTFAIWMDMAAEKDAAPDAWHRLEGLRVLLADPAPGIRSVLREQMAAWGVHVDEAGGGVEALQRLTSAAQRGTPYGGALIDQNLPDLKGLDLAKALQAMPALAATQCMLMVGYSDPLADVDAVGLRACLRKPVRASRLFDCLADLAGVEHFTPEAGPAPLPATLQGPLPAVASAEAGPPQGRVLLAEDNRTNQTVTRTILEKFGYAVDIVENGRDAVAAVAREAYVLVLMDCQMPEMDGFEASAAIRALGGATGRVPIVALTANALQEDRERCLAAGMDDYLAKPFKSKTLREILDRWAQPAGTLAA